MLLRALSKIGERGTIRTVQARNLTPRRLMIPKEDAIPPIHVVGREELVLAGERTGFLATEVGGRLESAITSKMGTCTKGRDCSYIHEKERIRSPTPKGGGKKSGNQCPFFAKGT